MNLGGSDQALTDAERRAVELDWTAVGAEIVAGMKRMLNDFPRYDDRKVEVGRGAGGDNTLVIDDLAENIVFEVLERVAREGAAFTVVSEERGVVDLGAAGVRVIVDPIDGSLNAKRVGQSFSLSLAVATGETIADVVYGFVYDFGSGEQWTARLGEGAWLGERKLRTDEAGNGLEVVGLESTKPAFLTPQLLAAFDGRVQRIRSIGSIALTLCQVAAARFDGMLSLRSCRAVDAAAGQLIVREAGGHVIFGAPSDDFDAGPLAVPLDLIAHKPVAAARDEQRARYLAGAPGC